MNRENGWFRFFGFRLGPDFDVKVADGVADDGDENNHVCGRVPFELGADEAFGHLAPAEVDHHRVLGRVEQRRHLADRCKAYRILKLPFSEFGER